MSGGSWGYFYNDLDDVADRLRFSDEPERRPLGDLLKLAVEALHDIEWVDSGDYGAGNEVPAIESVFSSMGVDLNLITLSIMVERAEREISRIRERIDMAKEIEEQKW